jgi:hypothetical protein
MMTKTNERMRVRKGLILNVISLKRLHAVPRNSTHVLFCARVSLLNLIRYIRHHRYNLFIIVFNMEQVTIEGGIWLAYQWRGSRQRREGRWTTVQYMQLHYGTN